jgi:anti-sigma28 factor (negative regulator of flagellin synthesis)
MKRKIHQYAELFPMMTAAELEALAADIAENGLLHPIVLWRGAILDGRNRLLACEKAGVEPRFEELIREGDTDLDESRALRLVISANVQRRDLTAAQRAIVAARTWGLDGYSKGGRPEKGKLIQTESVSQRQLTGQFHISSASLTQARDVLAEAPDLAAQVESAAMSLAAAHDQLQQRRKQTAQKAKDAERVTEYKEAISSGEISLDEALQKAIEQEREQKERDAAEADARRNWLKEFDETLKWFERFLHERTDEHLTWYTRPDSPGLFDHGITAERIRWVISQLERTASITFGGKNERKARGPKACA